MSRSLSTPPHVKLPSKPSAVQIAAAAGARVIAVDVAPAALLLSRELGAEQVVDGSGGVPDRIAELTGGGAHVSLDALGATATCENPISSLRPRGPARAGGPLAARAGPARHPHGAGDRP